MEKPEVIIVGDRMSRMKVPVFTYECVTCKDFKERVGYQMIKHLVNKHGIEKEEANSILLNAKDDRCTCEYLHGDGVCPIHN